MKRPLLAIDLTSQFSWHLHNQFLNRTHDFITTAYKYSLKWNKIKVFINQPKSLIIFICPPMYTLKIFFTENHENMFFSNTVCDSELYKHAAFHASVREKK